MYGLRCWRMTESDLKTNCRPPYILTTLEDSGEFSGPRPSLTNIFSPATTKTAWHYHHAKTVETDRTLDERRARQHFPHSPSLETREDAGTRATQDHLALYCRRGTQDPSSHLEDRSEADSEQTGEGYLCCCPTWQPP